MFPLEMIRITGITDEIPLRCRTCSSTSCCIARTRPSSFEEAPIAARVLVDVNDHIVEMMDDPCTVWYWLLIHGSATRARARLTHTRVGDD